MLPFYAFGAVSAVNHGAEWSTFANKSYLEYFVAAEYYTLIGAASLHGLSLLISAWLGIMFHRIAQMPPDMNPLEAHLTRRAHKRNKSSVASDYSLMSESVKRLSTPLEDHRKSGDPYETLSRPPSIPFMHTRQGSKDSFASSSRDSRMDLPSRQYQVTAANTARNSVSSMADVKRASAPPRTPRRGTYTEIPLSDAGSPSPSRPNSSRPHSMAAAPVSSQPINASPTRVARFTEAWYASDSLIGRTRERERAMETAGAGNPRSARAYEALSQAYDMDSDSDRENDMRGGPMDVSDDDDDIHMMGDGGSSPINATGHPNPLRSHPTPPKLQVPRLKTPAAPLGEVHHNSRSFSGSHDRTPKTTTTITSSEINNSGGDKKKNSLPRPQSWRFKAPRARDSSIQPEAGLFSASKPYGQLKPSTPPVMVGSGRQVSSGNDFENSGILSQGRGYRRNVSGKVAEEGMAGGEGYSRYSALNI